MLGQWLALRLFALAGWAGTFFSLVLGYVLGFTGLQLFELKFELFDPARDPFGRLPELHPPELGDLGLELLDLQCAQLDCEFGRLQLGYRRRQFRLTRRGESVQRN